MVMTFTMWRHRTQSGVWRLCPWWPRLCRWFCWGQFRGSPDLGPAPICSRKDASWPNHRLGTQFFEVPRLSLHTGSGHWSVPVVSLHRPFRFSSPVLQYMTLSMEHVPTVRYRTAKMNEIIDLLLPLISQTIVQYSKVHFNIIYDILYWCNTEWNCKWKMSAAEKNARKYLINQVTRNINTSQFSTLYWLYLFTFIYFFNCFFTIPWFLYRDYFSK